MNTQYTTLGLLLFAVVMALLVNPTNVVGQSQIYEADHVQEFGTTKGTNITTGFLLVNARYVPPPYQVTRAGLSIFINDLRVDGPITKWPIPEEEWKGKPFTPPLDRDSVLREAEACRRLRESQLYNGFCIMLFSDLDRLVFRPDVTIAVMRILESPRSAEQKVGELEQVELGYDRTRDQLRALVNGFTPSPELTKRLALLAKSPATFRMEQERRARERSSQAGRGE